MRDINRIDIFCQQLAKEWKKVPDMRFGQLFNNIQKYNNSDLFYIEEDEMIEKIENFIKSFS